MNCNGLFFQYLYRFKDLFNIINVSNNLFEFLHDNLLFDDPLNLLDGLVLVPDLNYFLVFSYDFFNLFNDDRDLHNLFHNLLDIPVDIDQLRNDLLYLNNSRNFNHDLFGPLNLLDFRDSDSPLNDLFNNLLSCDDFLNNRLDRNNLFSFYDDFLDLLADVRNLLDNFLNSLVNNDFLLNSDDLLDYDLLDSLSYDFFNNLRYLNYFLNNLCDWNDSLDDLFHWNGNLDWNNDLPLDWVRLSHFDRVIDWFVHFYHLGDLSDNFNDFLNDHFVIDDFLLISWNFNDFVIVSLDLFLDINVHIFHCLNLDNSFLDDRYLDNPFNLFDLFFNDDFLNDPFYDLRNFNYFFHNSWNDNDPLDNLLYLNNFGDLDHLFNDLLNGDSNLFNSIHMSDYLNNFLLDIFDWLRNFNIMVDNLLNLDYLWLPDYLRLSNIYLLNDSLFGSLDDWLFNDFDDLYNFFVENGHLDYPLDLLDDLGDGDDGPIYIYLNFLYPVLIDNFLSDNGDFIWLLDNGVGLDYPLDDLGHFNYLLNSLDDGNGLLDDPVDDLVPHFNVVLNLLGVPVLDLGDDLLDDLLHLDDLRHLDDLLHYFLHDDWDLHDLLHDLLLRWDHHLLDHLHLLDLVLDVVDHSLHLDDLLDLDDPVHELLDSHYLRHFLSHLHNPLDNLWHLDDSLNYPFHWHYLLHNVGHHDRGLDWHQHFQLDLLDLLDLHDPLLDPLHDHDLGHLHDPVHYLLDYLLHLDDFVHHSEDLQNIIHIHHAHDLLVDHPHHSLVQLQDHSRSYLYLLQLFQ